MSADLSSLVGGKHAEGMEAGPSDRNQLSLEEKSKYLGGDMDHTHLVKGLDYALLQKVALQHPPPPPPGAFASLSKFQYYGTVLYRGHNEGGRSPFATLPSSYGRVCSDALLSCTLRGC